jgi:Flp pilus assembly protein TadG
MEHTFLRQVRQLKHNESGVAMVELAVSLPFFMGLVIGGVETANYASVVMQLNQITLHTADAAARIGTTTPSANKTISEAQINDVFQGSLHEGKRINLGGNHDYTDPSTKVKSTRGNARIILSSVEEVAAFSASAPRYRIRWQRCAGSAGFYKSNYGTTSTATSVTGVGPVGRQTSPPPGGVLMFVELQYYFKPMIVNGFSNLTDRTISQVASMVVRENRDAVGPTGSDGIYNNEKVTVSTC